MQPDSILGFFVLRVLIWPMGIAMLLGNLFLAALPFLIFMWLVRWLIS